MARVHLTRTAERSAACAETSQTQSDYSRTRHGRHAHKDHMSSALHAHKDHMNKDHLDSKRNRIRKPCRSSLQSLPLIPAKPVVQP